MPIYEYACKSCDHTMDALQKMSDDPLVECPECGKPELKRLISAPRFRLKGEGWYETDFKKDNQRNLAKGDTESPGDSKGDGKGDSKGDGKGDSKKESKTDKKDTKKTDAKAKATTKTKEA